MSTTSRTSPISPLPGQEDQIARLAASAEVGQVEGTNALEQFQRWLETKAHACSVAYDALPVLDCEDYPRDGGHYIRVIDECRVATKQLMLFKLEQGA